MTESVVLEQTLPEFTDIVRGPYVISSRSLLSEEQATQLIQMLLAGCDAPARSVLGGRSQSCVYQLSGIGRIFVKHYSHGGLLRALTAGRFIAYGKSRSQVEFEMLEHVRTLGVNAPRPLAVIRRGALVYGTWLVMEELSDARTLVEIQKDDGEALHRAMSAFAEQLVLLIRNRVLHVDLHPGNVLVTPDGRVHVVDFDKAYYFKGTAQALRDLYLRRWRRAVIKHGLSPVLSEMISLTLRSYHE